MIRVRQDKDEIIIREIPITSRNIFSVLSLIFLAVIYLLLRPGIYFSDNLLILSVIFGTVISLYWIISDSVITTKINKPAQTVSIRKQSLIKYGFAVYSFSEISNKISVKIAQGGRNGIIYRLTMPLKNGQKIELSTADGSSNSQYFDAAYLMNSYISDDSNKLIPK